MNDQWNIGPAARESKLHKTKSERERERERTGTGSVRNLLVAETNATE